MHLFQIVCSYFIFGLTYTVLLPNSISLQYVFNTYSASVNTKISITANTFAIVNADFFMDCAALCTMDSNCCIASFDKTTRKCSLYTLCCSGVIQQTDPRFITIFKQPQVQQLHSCSDLETGSQSGNYTIYPDCKNGLDVYCEMTNATEGWTIIQKRFNGQTDFYRDWNEYKTGFGDQNSEFWIGNDVLHIITSLTPHKLRIEIQSYDNETAFAEYSYFHVDNEANNYTLTVEGYSGTAGDGMKDSGAGGSLSGWGFSTKDRRHDDRPDNMQPCAENKRSGWWHRQCTLSNLNGLYDPGSPKHQTMNWRPFKDTEALKTTLMMIKPA